MKLPFAVKAVLHIIGVGAVIGTAVHNLTIFHDIFVLGGFTAREPNMLTLTLEVFMSIVTMAYVAWLLFDKITFLAMVQDDGDKVKLEA